jgi:hypothetical protein
MSDSSTHTEIKVEYHSDDDSMNGPQSASSPSTKVERLEEVKAESGTAVPSVEAPNRGRGERSTSISVAGAID